MYLNKQSRRKRKIRKPYTIHEFNIPRFASLGNSFKKKFRNDLQNKKKFKLFYGDLKRKFLKKQTKQIFNKTFVDANIDLLEIFERRLDSVLFRSRFSSTIMNAQQMILHGYVKVNKVIIKEKSYPLKQGDLIEINETYSDLVKANIKRMVSKL
jgi:small subunit ribosomal protein S4